MALLELYKNYLANPADLGDFDENAALHYVVTLTSLHGIDTISKHIAAQRKVLLKKEEKILGAVVGVDSICLDIETTIEFISGGGAYLPGLDDNFVADRTVTFPLVHIVQFDSSNKIRQVRLYWDQGSLLKQIDVIGARARSWPIRDGKDQARLIASSSSNTAKAVQPASLKPSGTDEKVVSPGKSMAHHKNVTRDPHASLELFASYDDDNDGSSTKVTAPRASARPATRDIHDLLGSADLGAFPGSSEASRKEDKVIAPKSQVSRPPPRDYHDLFVGDESPSQTSAKSSKKVESHIAPKIGAGKNYKPSRLFGEEEDNPETPRSPSKGSYMKPHPKKYDHFEFGDGDDAPAVDPRRAKTKHQSQWDFEDFVTPQKLPTRPRAADKANPQFGWEDDEALPTSPGKQSTVSKARPDAVSTFEFQDDGTPSGTPRPAGPALGGTNARTSALYENNVLSEENQRESSHMKKEPLTSITNLKDRRKDFNSQFSMADASPGPEHDVGKPVPEARKKVVSQMGATWDAPDDSPAEQGQGDKENRSQTQANKASGIVRGGDGMGGKIGAGRSWGFGDDDEPKESAQNFRPARRQQGPKQSEVWDF